MAEPNTNSKKEVKLGLLGLTALVVGSIIGSGIFNLTRDMSASASLMGIVISWIIAGLGMTFLVLCFFNLSRKRPDLEAGIYSYAKEGFGKYVGFNSAWGYWISAWIGNVAYATLAFSALGYFFGIFEGGQNLASIIGASIALWLVAFLISRGIKQASFMNTIVTIAKLVPILIFIVIIMAAFKLNIFTSDVWGNAMNNNGLVWENLIAQIKSTMLITVFVFIGIEGAAVFSGRAKRAKDVGKATILGLMTVMSIYILVTVLSLGVMTAPELANLDKPAMASLLEHVVGKWGSILVNLGVIISIAGAWLAWTLFAMELPYRAAKNKAFPAFFAKESKRGVPIGSLLVTTVLIQLFIFIIFVNNAAYEFAFSLCSSMILIPYALTAFYQLKYSAKEDKTRSRVWNIIVGAVASIYAIWLLYAGGLEFLLIMTLLYAAGIIVYVITQKQVHAKKLFTSYEWVLASIFTVVAIYAIYWLATGGYQAIMG